MQMTFGLLVAFTVMPWTFVHSGVFIEKVVCDYDNTVCWNATCYHVLSRALVSKVTFGCYYPKPIISPMALLRFSTQENNSKPFIEVEENVCKIISSTTRNQVIERLFQNFNVRADALQCPFHGNVTIYKMPMNLNGFDSFLSRAKYIGQLQLRKLNSKKIYYDMKVYFSLRKPGKTGKTKRN